MTSASRSKWFLTALLQVLLAGSVSSPVLAQKWVTNSEGYPVIAGSWYDADSHDRITITQQAGAFVATHTRRDANGVVFSWRMEGTLSREGKFTGLLEYTEGLSPSASGYSQSFVMTLSADANQLAGRSELPRRADGANVVWRRLSTAATSTATTTAAQTTATTQSTAATSSATTIEGRWSVNFNNYTGTMEFTRSGSGWTGRLNLNAGNESLTNIVFDARAGSISFLRPAANQRYTGTLSGDRMSGRFDNMFNWSATRLGAATSTATTTAAQTTATTQSTAATSSATTIEGRWSVNFNNYTGTMEFTRSGSGWTGRLNLNAGNESLTNIVFDARTGSVSFLRPAANQRYTGTLSGDRMSGRFDNMFNWSATR